MSGVILQARGLGKSYGAIKVLHDIDMTLHEGESRVVIGPNGAGKTTLFKCLSGETQGNAGTITLQGRDVTREPGFRRVRAGVGRTFQVARVFPDMTVRENLTVAVEMRERIAGAGLRQLLSLAPRRAVAAEVSRLVEDFGLFDNLMLGCALRTPISVTTTAAQDLYTSLESFTAAVLSMKDDWKNIG